MSTNHQLISRSQQRARFITPSIQRKRKFRNSRRNKNRLQFRWRNFHSIPHRQKHQTRFTNAGRKFSQLRRRIEKVSNLNFSKFAKVKRKFSNIKKFHIQLKKLLNKFQVSFDFLVRPKINRISGQKEEKKGKEEWKIDNFVRRHEGASKIVVGNSARKKNTELGNKSALVEQSEWEREGEIYPKKQFLFKFFSSGAAITGEIWRKAQNLPRRKTSSRLHYKFT